MTHQVKLDAADVTVCIPTIPPRGALLARAVASVMTQTCPPSAISVATDMAHKGHGPTRTRAALAARTEWLAFLDDDDALYPQHLQLLLACQRVTKADLIYPWFDVIGGEDPFPQHFGKPYDPAAPVMFPVTVLIRRDAYLAVSGMGGEENSDWNCWNRLNDAGAKIVHLPERSWAWYHTNPGQLNTSGQGNRW